MSKKVNINAHKERKEEEIQISLVSENMICNFLGELKDYSPFEFHRPYQFPRELLS